MSSRRGERPVVEQSMANVARAGFTTKPLRLRKVRSGVDDSVISVQLQNFAHD